MIYFERKTAIKGKISFDHCVIHVGSWERATAFYHDVFGSEVIPYGRGALFRFGPFQLNTHGSGQIGTPRAELPVMPGGSDLCFECHGPMTEAIQHLTAHGVPVELGPFERTGARGQGKSVYFRDPDGSFLEFITYGADERSPQLPPPE